MTTSEMVESAWDSMGHFLYYLEPDIRKITRRLERLHLKIFKRNQSAVFNQTCLDNDLALKYIHIYIFEIRWSTERFVFFF